jgi:nucleotide-binding universal stress UspA family protein
MRTRKTSGSIVVGVDDSDGSRAAIRWAAAAARAHRWPLTFVHAYADLMYPPVRGFVTADADLRVEANEVVDRAEQHLRATGWAEQPTPRIVHPARPDHLLIELSDETRMVVVGRRGTGGFRDMLVGSTAYRVAEHCKVPVVIVPQGWDAELAAGKPVVIGLDEDCGEEAIGFAFDVASRTSQRLEAIHVFAPPLYLAAGGFGGYWAATEGWTADRDEAIDERKRLVSEQLANWLEKYPDVQVKTIVVYGYPASVLIDKTSEAELLVVGGVDHGRLASALVGSVARNLMHHATCPLAIVHAAR